MATKKRTQAAPAPKSTTATKPVTATKTTGGNGSGTVEVRSTLDVGALREIVEILEASDVTRLSWRRGAERLLIRRGPIPAPVSMAAMQPMVHQAPVMSAPAPAAAPQAPAAPAASPAPAAAEEEKPGTLVTSPFVGTFYRTPAPDQPPFVDVGTVIRKGQTLCIVEAMKLMNEIEAETAGKITEVLAQNGQPVEFGQPLFRIEPV